jgi:hypothetical protein
MCSTPFGITDGSTRRVPVDNLVSNGAHMVVTALAWDLKAWCALLLPEKSGRRQERRRTENRWLLGLAKTDAKLSSCITFVRHSAGKPFRLENCTSHDLVVPQFGKAKLLPSAYPQLGRSFALPN